MCEEREGQIKNTHKMSIFTSFFTTFEGFFLFFVLVWLVFLHHDPSLRPTERVFTRLKSYFLLCQNYPKIIDDLPPPPICFRPELRTGEWVLEVGFILFTVGLNFQVKFPITSLSLESSPLF